MGYFIDCRAHSKTFGLKVVAKFNASSARRLIIPRGVAHSFDNLQGIVTRDEPVWFSDFYNPDWDINNDLISLRRDITLSELPKIRPNIYLLPDDGHHLFSRIQQDLLQDAKRYAKREKLAEHSDQYRIVENPHWKDESTEYEKWLELQMDIPGLEFRKNNYALTGSKSYTIVPSTSSCVADVMEQTPFVSDNRFWLHYRQRVSLTFLAPEATYVVIEVCDLRQNQTRKIKRIDFRCDPRVRLVIPQGVAYRFLGNETYHIRYETEIFVDKNEPRSDIPLLGRDISKISDNELYVYPIRAIPEHALPDGALHLLAREEIRNFLTDEKFRSGKQTTK